MVNSKRKITILIIIFVLLITVFVIFSYTIKNRNQGDKERKIRYDIPGIDSCIWAYKDTPKIVIKNAKKFLIENGFCGDYIQFTFQNKYLYFRENKDFTFSVVQSYKNIYCSGYFEINLNGDIEIIDSLKTAKELYLINTESDIDSVDAIQIGIDYLNLKDNTTDGSVDKLYLDPSSQKWIFVYDVRFENQTIQLIIDGITGKILEDIRGEDIKKDEY